MKVQYCTVHCSFFSCGDTGTVVTGTVVTKLIDVSCGSMQVVIPLLSMMVYIHISAYTFPCMHIYSVQ